MSSGQHRIAEPARRHGITDTDMLHAIQFHVRRYDQTNGMTMYIGFDTQVRGLLEVGVIETTEGPVVMHAMTARPRFLRRGEH